MDSTELIRLDGGMLEGGGQLLRIAIALSALLSKPVAIDNIRAGRQSPGLKNQHVAGLRLVAEIRSARLEGCEVKSTSITFYPTVKPQTSKPYTADPKTAGSIALLLQVSLPCLIFAPSTTGPPSELILRGGTNAPQAPQIDYMQHVLLPFIQKHFGVPATLSVPTRGYYPKGGGEVHVSVPPVLGPLPAVTLIQRGAVKVIHGRSYVAGLPKSLAEAMRVGAINVLAESGVDTALISIDAVREKPSDAFGSGSGVVLWAETENGCILAGSALGSKRIDPAQVGRDAARELAANLAHGGCVDEYLQDQMIIFMALARGKSKVKTGPLTLHTRTALWVAEQLTDAKFSIEELEDSIVVECEGTGYCLS
ncbi:RNA 3'-terminal phosphate cyclase [Trametes versicolor FP-101664 SS1]|uniref:RNA 3'-terminal phosphate cyclase n=1 Tax=Trametes versicolor (strain FP-101664) TaxID=717944 RepID=UPI000462138F|nr:RNA 3'-terminal phosphate cyclase [Trametes versicolor FP-101664 SS1]EIW60648.1 RNA 3'-terminal phosphate cyclase [Trametes versicolor FP-101664 SS1]